MNAIEFDNISKQYRLGYVSSKTLSHDLNRWWTVNVLHKEDPFLKVGEVNDRSVKGNSDYVWALKDISFNVKQGDVVGIIGKNGAGKSTLLKLLSRVTNPTTGIIRAKGRIASLLEVGTGFHSELTGRENIYMNGAIMGMTKQEINRKFDEIVNFAGVERYVDTPVKRYSSGMTVRLGFAVAAHLDPEILVVDEVLAVGDAEFQKKAIGKMQDVSKGEGRTVLFVSHNMTSIKSLCNNGVLLENGYVKEVGPIEPIVSHYLRGDNEADNHKFFNKNSELSGKGFEMIEIGVKKTGGDYSDIIHMEDSVEIYMKYLLTEDKENMDITLHLKNDQGEKLFSCTGGGRCYDWFHKKGLYEQRCVIPANFFNWGDFSIDVYIIEDNSRSFLRDYDVISFSVVNKAVKLGEFMGKEPGNITPQFNFYEKYLNDF